MIINVVSYSDGVFSVIAFEKRGSDPPFFIFLLRKPGMGYNLVVKVRLARSF